MNEIIPTINTTKEEIEQRIKYMVDTADYLDELSKTNLQQAKEEFRKLRKFSERENHILNLVRNGDVVRNSEYLKNIVVSLHIYTLLLDKLQIRIYIGILVNFIRQNIIIICIRNQCN